MEEWGSSSALGPYAEETQPTGMFQSILATLKAGKNADNKSSTPRQKKDLLQDFTSCGEVTPNHKRKRDDMLEDFVPCEPMAAIHTPTVRKPGYAALTDEILSWNETFVARQHDLEARNVVYDKVLQMLQRQWISKRNWTLEIYGSMRTGLLLPSSDLDLCIVDWGVAHYGTPPPPDKRQMRGSTALMRSKYRRQFNSVSFIDCKHPIIKLRDSASSIDVDIGHNAVDGIATSDLLIKHMKSTPNFKPVYMALKQFMSNKKANDPSCGYLGGYSLAVMVLYYIWTHHRNNQNLGEIFVGFFEYFGKYFPDERHGISITGGKPQLIPKADNGRMWLENPLYPGKNLAAATSKWCDVRRLFSDTTDMLSQTEVFDSVPIKVSNNFPLLGSIWFHEKRQKSVPRPFVKKEQDEFANNFYQRKRATRSVSNNDGEYKERKVGNEDWNGGSKGSGVNDGASKDDEDDLMQLETLKEEGDTAQQTQQPDVNVLSKKKLKHLKLLKDQQDKQERIQEWKDSRQERKEAKRQKQPQPKQKKQKKQPKPKKMPKKQRKYKNSNNEQAQLMKGIKIEK